MIIKDFKRQQGYYAFEASSLTSSWHAHPAWEIITAERGTFSLETTIGVLRDQMGVIIPPSLPHKLTAVDGLFEICMLDIPATPVLEKDGSVPVAPVVIATEDRSHWEAEAILRRHLTTEPKLDTRIRWCLDRIRTQKPEAPLTVKELAKEVFLSSSRLAHLFKKETGISVQKYQLWLKLGFAVSSYLSGNWSLTETALQAGFYDAAHFSRVFREMLGEKPSFAYNSNSIQDIG